MNSIAESWDEAKRRLNDSPRSENAQVLTAANGSSTVLVDGVLLHSKYDPQQEAARLVDAKSASFSGTVIVYGAGLGYHLQEILNRGADRLIVIEPREDVVKAFFEAAVVDRPDQCVLFIGRDPSDIAKHPAFLEAAKSGTQPFHHPASVRLTAGYYELLDAEVDKALARQRRWKIAVVSPMYGGSLPTSRYVANALTAMGHRVDFIDNSLYYDAYKSVDDRLASEALRNRTKNTLMAFLSELVVARAIETRPHIVLALAQAPLHENAVRQIRRHGIVTAFWFVENYRHLHYWKALAPQYDFFFTIQEGDFLAKLDSLGVRNYKCVPTGCDPQVHRRLDLSPEEQAEYGSDISFAGAGYYNRRQMFEGLVDYDLKIWGTAWEQSRRLREFVQGDGKEFTTDEMVKIFNASKISLNLHSSAQHEAIDPDGDFVNPRLFEVASCGAFQLVDERKEIRRFFEPEQEVVTFRNLSDLRDKVDYYLAHEEERTAIAERARTRAHNEHTYQHRMAEMLDFISDRAGDRLLAHPDKEYLTVGEVSQRPDTPHELRAFLDMLPADMPFNLQEIGKKMLEREGNLTESEAIFMMLKEIADNPRIVLKDSPQTTAS